MEPDPRDHRCHRPCVFDKMEAVVRGLQDREHGGIEIRCIRTFLQIFPEVFVGFDCIEWLYLHMGIEEPEALNLAMQLCQYGYAFPVESKTLAIRDDSTMYRFQSPYYWPWQNRPPDNVEYAIYLVKRTFRNKQRHGLEEYELESLSSLRKNLANKWDFIIMQAEEQVRLDKLQRKLDKIVKDSQERAYWRIHRPPPGIPSSLEPCPVPTRSWNGIRVRRRTLEGLRREVELLRNSLTRTRIKVSQALESMVQHVETYMEYDPLMAPTQPSNPWVSEDTSYWQLNSPLVEIPTEKRVRRWGLSMEELVSDPTGLQEFTNYLRKEYSHENIRFWMAVNDLRRSAQSQIHWRVNEIFEEFLAPGAPCEINIDGKTMEKVHQEMKTPSRFTFDAAQEHVYTLLLKKDCYPRFVRSEHYKNLLATGIQPSQKKRFFGFGPTKKKASTSTAPNQQLLQQQTSQGTAVSCGPLSKRRGSDRSLSGSAHELAVSGVKDSKVPHSHSQSNLSDIPYRGDMAGLPKANPVAAATIPSPVKKPSIAIVAGASTSEEVCPWEAAPPPPEVRSRKNSAQLDSESSSSDISLAIQDVTERVQRTSILTQQLTLDGGRKLSANPTEPPRRASVSVPITHSTTESSKRKVSSFEDSSSAATSTSSSVFIIPSDTDNKSKDCTSTSKTLKKSHSLAKTCSVTGANAPIISVSSVADDIPVNSCSSEEPEKQPPEVASTSQQTEPLAPLAEPDSESPASEMPPSEPTMEAEAQAQEEAKSNDVCPWEDEETCKVDTPFVKTYATLGYL